MNEWPMGARGRTRRVEPREPWCGSADLASGANKARRLLAAQERQESESRRVVKVGNCLDLPAPRPVVCPRLPARNRYFKQS
jgi:hypothetical protein